MFIIAAAGTVKALMAVTISLHPGTPATPSSRATRCRRLRPIPTARRPTGPPCGGSTATKWPTRT